MDITAALTPRRARVSVDPHARTTRVDAGATWDPVIREAAFHGLAAPHPTDPDADVVAHVLGGGLGWLSRRHGLAANAVTAIHLATPDGHTVRVDADHDPDLFWALRGGGDGLGVVTSVEFRLFPVRDVYAGWLVWPGEAAGEVLHRWIGWTRTVPDEVTSLARVLRLPAEPVYPEPLRGRDLVVMEAVYLGDRATGERLLKPLLRLAPQVSTFRRVRPEALAHLHQGPHGPMPGQALGMLLDEVPTTAIDLIDDLAGPDSDSPLVTCEVRHLGGALARPVPGGGVLSHIDAAYAVAAAGIPHARVTDADIAARLHALGDALAPLARGRLRVGPAAGNRVEPLHTLDAPTAARLQAVRRRVAPHDPGRHLTAAA